MLKYGASSVFLNLFSNDALIIINATSHLLAHNRPRTEAFSTLLHPPLVELLARHPLPRLFSLRVRGTWRRRN